MRPNAVPNRPVAQVAAVKVQAQPNILEQVRNAGQSGTPATEVHRENALPVEGSKSSSSERAERRDRSDNDSGEFSAFQAELNEMRMLMVTKGSCTAEQALAWGLYDHFPKKHSSWISSTHMFEKSIYNDHGPCKFCGKSLDDLVKEGTTGAILYCPQPEAAVAAAKRKAYAADNGMKRQGAFTQ